VLLAQGSHGPTVTPHQHHGIKIRGGLKRFSSAGLIPSSLGKQQWQFRLEKKVTLRPPRKSSAVNVRAKKSGIGECYASLAVGCLGLTVVRVSLPTCPSYPAF
jgi:hypothetical protein